MEHFQVWLTILSALVVINTLVLYLVIRQVGILLANVGPVGARSAAQGPRLGENIAQQTFQCLERNITEPTLIVFGSPSCAICESIKQAVFKLYKFWHQKAQFFLVYDREEDAPEQPLREKLWLFYNDDLRVKLDVKMLPFALMLDGQGQVVAQGLVNDISNVESLLEALETT